MFNKKEKVMEITSQDKFDTLVGENTSFEGLFKAEGAVRIDGKIKGEVAVKGDVFLGENGVITGNVHATNLIISGKIEGNVNSSALLRITSTGKILGDVTVKSFIVDEDAFFEGKCIMTHQNSTQQELDDTSKKARQS
ncbi:MAG: polymer-forming cytoskeletal protein [Clostridiaceae bacterium]|nr:polymer-forming cytoskeletal protein [Clostridiaceae bacterium]